MTTWAFELFSMATIILIVAALLGVLLRRASAAARHNLWTAAFAALLLLPAARFVLPSLQIPILPLPVIVRLVDGARPVPNPTANTYVAVPVIAAGSGATIVGGWTGAEIFGLVWITGVAGLVWRGFFGALSRRRWTRALRPRTAPGLESRVRDLSAQLRVRRNVRVVVSADDTMPVTWGITHPVLVLPASAPAWQTERPSRLDAILLHELAHIARFDAVWQTLGRIVATALWFHPLAWHAVRRSRLERERACDDVVLTSGHRASDYARDLVAMARTLASPARPMRSALHMARPSHLETRVEAMLDDRMNRHRASWGSVMITVAGVFAISPLGNVHLVARTATPVRQVDAAVVARTSAEQLAEALRLPAVADVLKVTARSTGRISPPLPVQPVAQSYRPSGTKAPKLDMSTVVVPMIVKRVEPVYPQSAIDAGIQGSSLGEAIIDRTGQIIEAHITESGAPVLDAATLEAFRQWRYSP